MQIPKDEVRQQILEAAEKEFVKRGFKDASMRVIAKKAHTTIGNLYNYFENKEGILDGVVGELPNKIDEIIENHREQEVVSLSVEEMNKQIAEYMPQAFGLDLLLGRPFVILIEGCEGTKYAGYKEIFLEMFREHLREHLKGSQHEMLVNMLAHSFLQGVIFIAKNKGSLEEGKKDLTHYLQMMIQGIIAFQK